MGGHYYSPHQDEQLPPVIVQDSQQPFPTTASEFYQLQCGKDQNVQPEVGYLTLLFCFFNGKYDFEKKVFPNFFKFPFSTF